MKQIELALHNYEGTHGRLPPVFIATSNASMHTQLLPYFEAGNSCTLFNFNVDIKANASNLAARQQ